MASGAGLAADEGTVVLAVGGRAGVKVVGTCLVRAASGEVSEAIDAAVPFERRWRASGVRCELQADGPATIDVGRGGNRSRTATSGGRTVIDVR
jgi:hypothetical protein